VKIKEIMTKNPIIVPPSTPLSTIQSIFNKNQFWSVYVGDSDRFLGIITRKDLHIRGKGLGPYSRADTIMSKNVLTLDENSDIKEAIKIIKQKKINGLGVTKEGKPNGIITKADIKKKYDRKAFDIHNDSDRNRIKMTVCDFCGEKIKEIMPWKCSYCHGSFCSEHRLPEYHNCSGLTGHAATRSFKAQTTRYSDEKSIQFLLPALKSESADERKKNAILLKGRGYIPHTDAEKSTFHFARQNWDDLVALGTPALEPLITGLEDTDVNIQIACARSLGILGNPDAIAPLLQILYKNGTAQLLRNAIIIALGNLGWSPKTDIEKISFFIAQQQWRELIQFREKIIGPLSALLDDKDEEIRYKAIELLCELRDNKVIGILRNALYDRSKKVRITALNGIVELKDPENVEALITALEDEDFAIQRIAQNGLVQLDTDAVDSLINRLKKIEEKNFEAWEIKNKIIFVLGEIQDARARDILERIHETANSDSLKKISQEAIKKIDLHGNELKQKSKLYCLTCFSNFKKQPIIPFINSSIPACRNCKSTKNYLENVNKVVLLLDKMNNPYEFKNNILSVNWFKIKRPIDMHEISIVHATNEDISELVMKLKNDDDSERKKQFKQISVTVVRDLGISQAKINLLKNTFGNVHVVENDTVNRRGE